MKVNEILIPVRQRLGDMNKIKFSDSELIYCLNNAIDRLCVELAEKRFPEIVKEMKLQGSKRIKRPEDFIGMQGQFPVAFIMADDGSNEMYHIDPNFEGELTIRYFATKPHVTSLDDTLPFNQTPLLKLLMTYVVYEVKPSAEKQMGGGNNDGQGTDGEGGST